jgi:DNA-binding Lrp family transcriptional regulator
MCSAQSSDPNAAPAVPGPEIEDHLLCLSKDAGFEDYLPLPTVRLFHIGVKLNMSDDHDKPAATKQRPAAKPKRRKEPVVLTEQDKNRIRITQDDLPLVERPFDDICRQLDISFDQLQSWFTRMQDLGVLRRFAAILKHRSAGFLANGMVVWRIDAENIEQAGLIAADVPEVSHCYQRPLTDKWPYNLYTMIHAKTPEQCGKIISRIEQQLQGRGLVEFRTRYSTREFKKQRVRYFV